MKGGHFRSGAACRNAQLFDFLAQLHGAGRFRERITRRRNFARANFYIVVNLDGARRDAFNVLNRRLGCGADGVNGFPARHRVNTICEVLEVRRRRLQPAAHFLRQHFEPCDKLVKFLHGPDRQ